MYQHTHHIHQDEKKVLISGGGIAGLTLGILLKENGWDPLIVERSPVLRPEGYMMDFFGTGWDVAERMGLVDDIRRLPRPIDSLGTSTAVDLRVSPVPITGSGGQSMENMRTSGARSRAHPVQQGNCGRGSHNIRHGD